MVGSVLVSFSPSVSAAGSVTLSATFHDDDAEDTHQATQWIVRDDITTVFDSGTDTVNKESITVGSSYFTAGTTYYWKARMQDQHSVWGAYSSESTFVYGSAALSPTPEGSITATLSVTTTASSTTTVVVSPTDSPTATTTATASVTVTMTSTASPTAVPTNSITPIPDTYLMDAEIIYPTGNEFYELGSDMKIEYYAYPADLSGSLSINPCADSLSNWKHDLYISTDNGNNFDRILSEINYGASCQYFGDEKGAGYVKISVQWHIPDDQKLISSNAKMAVVVYRKDDSGNYGLGSRFSANDEWSGGRFRNLASDASNKFSIISDDVSINVIRPYRNTIWMAGGDGDVEWGTSYSSDRAVRVMKVNILLSTDGGDSYSHVIATGIDNSGEYNLSVKSDYKTENAMIKIEGLSSSNNMITMAQSEIFSIRSSGACIENCVCIGSGCVDAGDINDVIILGTIITLALPYLWLVFSSLPLATKVSPVLQQLFGGIPFFVHIGELTGWPIFFPPMRRNQKSWGIVYDSINKKPIQGATVKIYTKMSERLKDIKFTNENGEFSMLVPPDTYKIVVVKTGYKFPSSIIITRQDGRFSHVYHGEFIDIKQTDGGNKAPIEISVPMDAVGFSIYEAAYAASVSLGKRFLTLVRYPLLVVGMILSFYLTIKYSQPLQYFISAIYILVLIMDIKNLLKQKSFGRVLDGRGKPLDRVIVRALNRSGRIKATTVTGSDGKFIFNLNPGRYSFVASRNGYATSRIMGIDIVKVTDIGKAIIRIVKINQ